MDADVVEKPAKAGTKKPVKKTVPTATPDLPTETSPCVRTAGKGRKMRVILVSSPKGGVGKTSISRNLAVAAAMGGLRVATLDFDAQGTLTKWWSKRTENVVSIEHYQGELKNYRAEFEGIEGGIDLLVIDTPTSVEEHIEAMKYLMLKADFILVPTGHTGDDRDSVLPWMELVRTHKRPAAFVMNKVNVRTKSFRETRQKLLEVGKVVPEEIPQAEDIPNMGEAGYSVVEVNGVKGGSEFIAVWNYLRLEIEL